jgi:hypothetical protein
VAKRVFQIQIETRPFHELSIPNQAIRDFHRFNVRTLVGGPIVCHCLTVIDGLAECAKRSCGFYA